MKRNLLCLLAAGMLLMASGCSADQTAADNGNQTEQTTEIRQGGTDEVTSESRDIFAMDTYMTVTAYGADAKEAVDDAEAEINRLDQLLSTGDEESEIARLNVNKSGTLSEDGGYLVERALELYDETDGAFDIAVYPIMQAWGFPTKQFQVPEQSTLDALLPLTDAGLIRYDAGTREISFEQDGMEIDLGGIAKGYTSSRIVDIFKEHGITSGLINLGGNVQVLGGKMDGTDWRVAVQSPDDSDEYVGILSIRDKAVITSGGYERYFEQDGVTYHHIIDPATGYPAETGLKSVTVVSSDGTLADGLSTSLFVMGKDKACEFWKAHSDEFDFILMADDNTLYVSEGIADAFSSDYDTEVIR